MIYLSKFRGYASARSEKNCRAPIANRAKGAIFFVVGIVMGKRGIGNGILEVAVRIIVAINVLKLATAANCNEAL